MAETLSFVPITSGQTIPGAPLDTTLMSGIRNNLDFLKCQTDVAASGTAFASNMGFARNDLSSAVSRNCVNGNWNFAPDAMILLQTGTSTPGVGAWSADENDFGANHGVGFNGVNMDISQARSRKGSVNLPFNLGGPHDIFAFLNNDIVEAQSWTGNGTSVFVNFDFGKPDAVLIWRETTGGFIIKTSGMDSWTGDGTKAYVASNGEGEADCLTFTSSGIQVLGSVFVNDSGLEYFAIGLKVGSLSTGAQVAITPFTGTEEDQNVNFGFRPHFVIASPFNHTSGSKFGAVKSLNYQDGHSIRMGSPTHADLTDNISEFTDTGVLIAGTTEINASGIDVELIAFRVEGMPV